MKIHLMSDQHLLGRFVGVVFVTAGLWLSDQASAQRPEINVPPQPQRWTGQSTRIPTGTNPGSIAAAHGSGPTVPASRPARRDAPGAGTPIHNASPEHLAHDDGDSGFPMLSADSSTAGGRDTSASAGGVAGPAVTVTSSLAVVLGLFAAMIWLSRRFGSRSVHQGVLPKDVFESLGSTAIDARTRISLLRCGARVLVVAQTQTGIQPLAEISDPDEVRRLTATCLGDANRTFLSAMKAIEKEPAQPGFVDSQGPQPAPRKRSRLFATA